MNGSVRASVRLSVTPFSLGSLHRIIMKLSGVITKSDVHAKGQGQRSKVKVTEVKTQFNCFRTVTPVWIYIWWWNDAQSLMRHWNVTLSFDALFLYARLKNGRIMLWQCPSVCPSVRPSVRPSFPDFFSTCFEISIWNLVYAFSRWHDMSSLSFITIGSIRPSLQPKVGQTQFLQSWPYKSR